MGINNWKLTFLAGAPCFSTFSQQKIDAHICPCANPGTCALVDRRGVCMLKQKESWGGLTPGAPSWICDWPGMAFLYNICSNLPKWFYSPSCYSSENSWSKIASRVYGKTTSCNRRTKPIDIINWPIVIGNMFFAGAALFLSSVNTVTRPRSKAVPTN